MAQVKFSLEEYLKDPSRKVVTRDGREVRIKCTDMDGINGMVIVGLVRDDLMCKERPLTWTKEGQYFVKAGKTAYDLFFEDSKEPVVRKGWVNIYKSPDGETIFGVVRESKEEAEQVSRGDCIDTIEVSWKE